MSNSDDKLDALYRREHDDSPEDLNELIRAAAKAAASSESGSVAGDSGYDNDTTASREPSTPRATGGWHKKAGWASAAVVMLTSLLFLGLPDKDNWQPRSELAGATTQADNAVAAPAPGPVPEPAAERTSSNDPALAETSSDVTSVTTSAERATSAGRAAIADTEAADYAPPVPASPAIGAPALSRETTELPPAAFSKSNSRQGATLASHQNADLMDSAPLAVEQAESNAGFQQLASSCHHYTHPLVSRACTDSDAQQWILQARQDSNCAGQRYALHQSRYPLLGPPVLLAAPAAEQGSKATFVFATDDERFWQLQCSNGQLKLQSLARGAVEGAGPAENAVSNQASGSDSR